MTLYDALNDLFKEYGYFQEGLRSLTLKGKDGAELIEKTLSSFRSEPLEGLAGLKVTAVEDYLSSKRVEEAMELKAILTCLNQM